MRLHEAEHTLNGDCRIDRIAPSSNDLQAGVRGFRMCGDDNGLPWSANVRFDMNGLRAGGRGRRQSDSQNQALHVARGPGSKMMSDQWGARFEFTPSVAIELAANL
nr:hypothetical protein [Pelagerythrobacter rhizovicinus]